MRIDYSEPKQSYIGGQAIKARPRKEPTGLITTIVIVTGLLTFLAGFGTGWFLSQRSAKKSFQAATEQNSLENSPNQPQSAPPVAKQSQPPAQPAPAAQQPQTAAATSTSQAAPNGQTTPEPPLSFYRTLPSGHQSNVLGSGINSSDGKGKHPLQAAIPSNLTRKPQPEDSQNTDTDKPAASEKSAAKPQKVSSSFVVQVASYSLKSEAEASKSKLSAKGYNVTINESNLGDKGIWYRVRVGKKLDQEAAKELAAKLGKGAIAIPDRD